jgi:hypothetical protein
MYGKINMNKTVQIMFLFLFSLSYSLAHDENQAHYVYLQDPNELINPNGFYKYMIIKDDYLSYVSNNFYNDPWKWTKIYQANQYIVDPNWIYPDNWLVIPDIYSDKDGNPITKKRSFTYQSPDLIISDAATENSIAKENILYQNDKSGDSQVHTTKKDDNDKTILLKSETQAIESDSEIKEHQEINYDETTDIELDSSLATMYNNDSNKDNKTNAVANQKHTSDLTNNDRISSNEDVSTKSSYDSNQKTDIIGYSDKNRKSRIYKKTTAYNNPNWIIGLHGGYPFGDVPDEDDNLTFGLLIGTPLRITLGVISARLGAGLLGYDFSDKLYPGAGVLLNLAISQLLNWSTPVQLQVHGTGFYVPDGGIGTGILASTSVPIGDSPFNIGLYIGVGEYNNDSVKSNLKNTGLVLQLNL